MITDNIANLSRYQLPYREDIIQFIKATDLKSLADGEHLIKGRDLLVKVMSYVPKPASENKFETHRIYADLQLVVTGVELMQTAPRDVLTAVTEYDAKDEYQFFTAAGFINDVIVRANEFTIFFPGEAHRPACQYQGRQDRVKKLVFKIRI